MDGSRLLPRRLPPELNELDELLTQVSDDLRWSWSHAGDGFWRLLDPDIWERTRNPYAVLHNISLARLRELASNGEFITGLKELVASHRRYLTEPCWGDHNFPASKHGYVAYFSMEFGLGKGLPMYAGGLGVLAGDQLKAASDLGVPIVGVGLLYQQGYFRQAVGWDGSQTEIYTYLDPANLPLAPVISDDGTWRHVTIRLPGRKVRLRVWMARIGRVALYLLDSNDPLNTPADRGITSRLYGSGEELRLVQEIALGVGGWGLIEALDLDVRVCHLNEGHAAFATLERNRCYMLRHGVDFWEALWATRAGNVFTTHTPVDAAFDSYSPQLLAMYGSDFAESIGIAPEHLLALGRRRPDDDSEPFSLAYLATRTCARANGVSRLHGAVSRRIFQSLFPRWPQDEVPFEHVTNGVHVPSWDSPWADRLWTEACGKGRWTEAPERLGSAIEALDDARLWELRGGERRDLVEYARKRLVRHLGERGVDPTLVQRAGDVLDPNALTLGFARRFTSYKRPNLLLTDRARFARLLTNPARPVQILVAGKAHPADEAGKAFIREWVEFAQRANVRPHVVFLEDYDMGVAQELVQGVDLWVNTPRPPMEACGTSGMKLLVNGGLNLSSLDGWWAEAYRPDVGWALSDGAVSDADEARELYRLLEEDIVPEFYDRDERGLPRRWIARMRASMGRLAPYYSANRMVRQYVEQMYLPAATAFEERSADGGALARELSAWSRLLRRHWRDVHLSDLAVRRRERTLEFEVQVYLGEIPPQAVQVQLLADAAAGEGALCQNMVRGASLPGTTNGFLYTASVTTTRPAEHYTPRVIPHHGHARIPTEHSHIRWWSGDRRVLE